jgi:hypothetical protein
LNPRERVEHPAPLRGRASLTWLWIGVVGAPVFWFAQEWLNYGFSSYTCYPGDTPLEVVPAGWNWFRTGVYVFDAAAILAALIAGYVSWRCWIATRAEMPGGAEAALELGEGRTRFLALWGMMYSVAFLAAIIFETIASIMVPLCGRAT